MLFHYTQLCLEKGTSSHLDKLLQLKYWDLPLLKAVVYAVGPASAVRGGPSGTNRASLT